MNDSDDPQIAMQRPRRLIATALSAATGGVPEPSQGVPPVSPVNIPENSVQIIDRTRVKSTPTMYADNAETINKMVQTLRSLTSPTLRQRVPVVRERRSR